MSASMASASGYGYLPNARWRLRQNRGWVSRVDRRPTQPTNFFGQANAVIHLTVSNRLVSFPRFVLTRSQLAASGSQCCF